jgi:hypothetical protein
MKLLKHFSTEVHFQVWAKIILFFKCQNIRKFKFHSCFENFENYFFIIVEIS